MPTDPYGFPTDEPQVESPSDPVSGGLSVVWALGSLAFAVICAACGGWIAVEADEPTALDAAGVWMIASACAWPALGIAFWSVLLHLGLRRRWTQAGPNVLIGVATGSVLWFVVLCALALTASVR